MTATATPTEEERQQALATIERLKKLAEKASSDREVRAITNRIVELTRSYRIKFGVGLPRNLVEQAREVDEGFVTRPHLTHLSNRIAQATRDVERGQNRMVAVSMPPRAGKSTLISQYGTLFLLRRHPEWKIMLVSHDGGLTSGWAKQVRRTIEDTPGLGIMLERDGGRMSQYQTIEGGGVLATSTFGGLTGRGSRVMIIDDPVRDFVEAHSARYRQNLWDWWLSVAQTRLEPPYLVLVVMTRWHEDDFIGRLLSPEYEGDPSDWEYVRLPAFAEADDALDRAEGAPLFTPLFEETPEQAIERWDQVRRNVGSYTFASMYQQRPAPAKGAIFDSGWWRFWTSNESRATEDGRVRYLDPSSLTGGRWLDSWDCAFKGGDSGSSYVVGQRWVRDGANRFLVGQKRGRWSFTSTLQQMKAWTDTSSPFGHLVHERLVEDKANGTAIIEVMREQVSGIKPINPTTSKESRARSVTPEVESGNVYLPHPGDPGNEWVQDLLNELRNFPHDANDDQVDALTQALHALRSGGRGSIAVPGSNGYATTINGSRTGAAFSDLGRRRY